MPDSPDPNLDPDSATIPMSGPRPTLSGRDVDLPLPEELAKLLPVGAYEVTNFLGAGGMGAVYKGTQIRLKRPVAIKIMRRDVGKDHDFEARFEREAQAMAKLNHPNIISVIDFGEAGPDYLFIVMELVDGTDLMDVIRSKQMTQEMALTLLPQICDALQFAHDHGIVHRDIKPNNIMLTRDGRVKMADFGLAKHFDHVESGFRTQTGTGMGTPEYAAPEQFDPTTPVDHRADIYALGVMIYQMITGALPRGVWRPPSQRAPVSTQWDAVVSRAMQNDPLERYQKASEVKTDVSSISMGTKEGSVGTPAHPNQSGGAAANINEAVKSDRAPVKSRAPLLVGIISAVVVVAVAALLQKKPEKSAATASTSVSEKGEFAALGTAEPSASWKDMLEHYRQNDGWFAPVWKHEKGRVEWVQQASKQMISNRGKDQAVRVTWASAAGRRFPTVMLRQAAVPSDLDSHYAFGWNAAQLSLRLHTNAPDRMIDLAQWPLPAGFDATRPHTYEFHAIGSELSVSVDGRPLGSFKHDELKEGFPGFWADVGTVMTELKIANLDRNTSTPSSLALIGQAAATKENPFINTLGMKFVPVPGTKVLFSIWDTRVMDYGTYAAAKPGVDGSWKTQAKDGVPVGREADHPVVGVSWEDAQAFCAWLTEKETAEGKLTKGAKYRLPTDAEWSTAVGLPPEMGATPEEKAGKNGLIFPWGKEWPPTKNAGNFADEAFHSKFPSNKSAKDGKSENAGWIEGYTDGYATTSPVGSFPANAFGLCDMGGNVWQWCEDWWNVEQKHRVMRGASWNYGDRNRLRSSYRSRSVPTFRDSHSGIRCVLEPAPSPAAVSPAPNLPVSKSSTQFPPGQWVKLFTKPEDLPADLRKPDSGVTWEDGWIRGLKHGQVVQIAMSLSWNYAIRLKSELEEVSSLSGEGIVVRRQERADQAKRGHYLSRFGGGKFVIQQMVGGNYQTLHSSAPADAPKAGEDYTLLVGVVGKLLVSRLNSTTAGILMDEGFASGKAFIGMTTPFRDIEVMNLDGLPEAEALRLLGVDEQGKDLRGKTGAAK